MPIDNAGRNLNSRVRRTALLLALLLSVSLVISLQPCCELFVSLFAPHSVVAGAVVDDSGHVHDVTAPSSGKLGDGCGHDASSAADLAKAVPAIPERSASSPVGAVLVAAAPREFSVVPRLLSAPVFHPSPPPFRIYLRFLHLLM